MYKYDEIFSVENLLEVHYRARKCKRHKNEVIAFEQHLTKNINKLHTELINRTYKVEKYKRFMIYDPKEREIQALSYYDRIVQNCLCYKFLLPFYSKHFIYDNCACQKGKGTHFARRELENFFHSYYKEHHFKGCILKLDIKKYFNNIDHDILKQKLGNIYDKDLKKLVYQIIDSYCHHNNCGLPMGNQSSQIFALLYLNNVDRLIKEKYHIKYYIRYMDDLIILHENKNYLKFLFDELKNEMNCLKLELNKKSQIFTFKNRIECLGVKYSFLLSGKVLKKMKKQSKQRMFKKISELKWAYGLKLLDSDDLKMSYAGFLGNVKRLQIDFNIAKQMNILKI